MAETRELYSLVPAAGCEPRVQHTQLQCNCALQDGMLVAVLEMGSVISTPSSNSDIERAVRCHSSPRASLVVRLSCMHPEESGADTIGMALSAAVATWYYVPRA